MLRFLAASMRRLDHPGAVFYHKPAELVQRRA